MAGPSSEGHGDLAGDEQDGVLLGHLKSSNGKQYTLAFNTLELAGEFVDYGAAKTQKSLLLMRRRATPNGRGGAMADPLQVEEASTHATRKRARSPPRTRPEPPVVPLDHSWTLFTSADDTDSGDDADDNDSSSPLTAGQQEQAPSNNRLRWEVAGKVTSAVLFKAKPSRKVVKSKR